MRYAVWDAQMHTPDKDGVREIDSVRTMARRGAAWANKRLQGPPFPEPLRYLWHWVKEIRRGLGRDMDGLKPLEWIAVDAWSRATDRHIQPHEYDAIFLIDSALRHPDAFAEPEAQR